MLDSFRENPRQVLTDMISARRERDPGYQPPALLGALTWMFMQSRETGARQDSGTRPESGILMPLPRASEWIGMLCRSRW